MGVLSISKTIKANPEKVWDTMLTDKTYRQWTKAFNPTSYFEGEWKTGSEIKFLGIGDDGKTAGMYSKIKEANPPHFVSILHLGMIKDGVVDTESEEVKKWAPSFENYTLKEKNGHTEILVEMQIHESYQEMFEKLWEKALKELKRICEED